MNDEFELETSKTEVDVDDKVPDDAEAAARRVLDRHDPVFLKFFLNLHGLHAGALKDYTGQEFSVKNFEDVFWQLTMTVGKVLKKRTGYSAHDLDLGGIDSRDTLDAGNIYAHVIDGIDNYCKELTGEEKNGVTTEKDLSSDTGRSDWLTQQARDAFLKQLTNLLGRNPRNHKKNWWEVLGDIASVADHVSDEEAEGPLDALLAAETKSNLDKARTYGPSQLGAQEDAVLLAVRNIDALISGSSQFQDRTKEQIRSYLELLYRYAQAAGPSVSSRKNARRSFNTFLSGISHSLPKNLNNLNVQLKKILTPDAMYRCGFEARVIENVFGKECWVAPKRKSE